MSGKQFTTELPMMLTIKQLAAEAQGHGISEYHIRRAIKFGKLKHVNVGRKILINRDRFIDYLNSSEATHE